MSVSWNHNLNTTEEYEVINSIKFAMTKEWKMKASTAIEIIEQKLGGRWSAIMGKEPNPGGGGCSIIKSPKFLFVVVDDYVWFVWKSNN